MTEIASVVSVADERGYPAYYARHHQRFVAWFCTPEEAEVFLEAGVDNGYIAAHGSAPKPSKQYEDLGHRYCGDDRHWKPATEERAVLALLDELPGPVHTVVAELEVPPDLTGTPWHWSGCLFRAVGALLERQLVELLNVESSGWLVITDAGREVLAATAEVSP